MAHGAHVVDTFPFAVTSETPSQLQVRARPLQDTHGMGLTLP